MPSREKGENVSSDVSEPRIRLRKQLSNFVGKFPVMTYYVLTKELERHSVVYFAMKKMDSPVGFSFFQIGKTSYNTVPTSGGDNSGSG